MSDKNTVNVPGGPAYVFGKKNLAHASHQGGANPDGVEGSASEAVNDFAQPETEPVDSEYSDAKVRADGTRDFSALKKGDRVNAMQEELVEGMHNLAIDEEQFKEHIDFVRSGYNYSFRNQILLAMQKPHGSNFKTYKQWSALGYQVQKGSQSASILRPIIKKEEREDSTGNTVMGSDGKPVEDQKLVGYASYGVFSEKDLDPSVKEPPKHPLEEHVSRYRQDDSISDNQAMREDLTRVAESMDIPVRVETPDTEPRLSPSAGGFASRTPDGGYEIVINGNAKEHSQTYTMAHEMGHILCGHIDDGQERALTNYESLSNIEVEAETVAYAISKDYGLDSGNRAFAYLRNWSDGDEKKISQAMGNVSKGLRSYYEKLEKSVTGTNRDEENASANTATKEAATKRRAAKKSTKKTTKKSTRRKS